jgi:hypothetical protein
MTLLQQFPDVSNLIREKKKFDLKYNAVLFKDIHYNPITSEEKFYNKEFKTWHYKLLLGLGLIFTGLYFFILNGRALVNWVVS